MRRRLLGTLVLTVGVCAAAAGTVPSPEEFLGHRIGEDRYLAPWPKVVAYLERVAAASDRVTIESAGTSTLGNDIPLVVVSSPANLARAGRLREIARRLADPRGLAPGELDALVEEGRAIVLVTCTIHSTEVGSTQMAMELVHELATRDDPAALRWLDEVVLLLMPSINPDGQLMVVDWYRRWLGTEWEGAPMPWLYHHYVGHDDNRDFYMLTQPETRAVNRVLYHRWFPQVYLDEHQMGATGPRMFVPPQTDPLAPEVHPLIFRTADLLGTLMAFRLEEAGKTGVGSNMIFDAYWPGGTRNTAWWKNVVGLLTEVASVNVASPVYVDPGELAGGAKGFPEYARRANFPSPWPGGWWRLREIVEYELVATRALLEGVAAHRREVLRNMARMARDAVAAGRREPPFAFLIPPDQHDPVAAGRLVDLLVEHGVEVRRATARFAVGRVGYPVGTYVVPAAQPYRGFLLTMLRPQRYPRVRAYPGGPALPPYDATHWSLPISMGVSVEVAGVRFDARTERVPGAVWPEPEVAAAAGGWTLDPAADSLPAAVNELLGEGVRLYRLARAGGAVWIPPEAASPRRLAALARRHHLAPRPLPEPPRGAALRLAAPRVGLYRPWMASMDEGWTRFLLERYGFHLEGLENPAMRDGRYAGSIDVLILPDIAPAIVRDGRPGPDRRQRWRPLPPGYQGGIGTRGGEALARWVRGGGTVVALNRSSRYLIELLELPVRDVVEEAEGFRCPGSMLRVRWEAASPLAWGVAPGTPVFFASSPAFATRPPDPRFRRRVVARYPEDPRDLLVSGDLEGGERLARRAALVELRVGRGRVVLFGFRPQYRAQTHATFKPLWNALYLAAAEPVTLPEASR